MTECSQYDWSKHKDSKYVEYPTTSALNLPKSLFIDVTNIAFQMKLF